METLKIVKTIVKAADEKKASDITVLDLKKVSSVTDYFVICTGNSTPQTKAIADNIEEKLEENYSLRILRREGYRQGSWILLDYGNVVIHIFKPEDREFYSLERLWGDAKVLETTNYLGD